ncbi:scd2/ral3 [Crepidotus variabilis]|uniref:Scd2/ral3 n=1 Tax=Crepidotus variabilis TaxID=179855 RepID=A0A9P6ETP6_9AGAR|nr:scd2/ral3 [Crepidotus variabilis]
MKSLRKSLNRDSNSRPQISTPVPLPSVSKPASAISPPQKVIRALQNYRSQVPQELSFSKGDFFYVTKDADVGGSWYEAHNPVSGARGLVPRAMFEKFDKGPAPSNRASQAGGNGLPSMMMMPPPPRSDQRSPPPKTQVYYAIVQHDFVAERPDELDAKRGDAITVVAQSNREWFVAKPIGRLGRPGLIPVSFVEIHDPASGNVITDIEGLMDRGELPKVEDWKRAMLTYKQNSIALGVIDAPTKAAPTPNKPYPPQHQMPPPPMNTLPSPSEAAESLPEGLLISADVVSFHFEMDEYWFRIDANFQPFSAPGQSRLPPSKNLILFRVYNDFYDFQVSLLEMFPREAGREPPEPRTLPYMPGPAADVDDELTATRRIELDEYIHGLCNLSKTGQSYILQHQVVRSFLALKPGDVENEGPPREAEIDALLRGDDGFESEANQIQEKMGRMGVSNGAGSDGSDYEDEGYAPSPQPKSYDNHPYSNSQPGQTRHGDDNLRYHAHAQNHSRNGSSASFHNPAYGSSGSRSNSPQYNGARNASPAPTRPPPNSYQHPYQQHGSTPSVDSNYQRSSQNSGPNRTRSQSNANTPPISAANPQTAFVKIKIFDRVADDLIAIRVHPRVLHVELMDKVQARLGGEVGNLRYRDSMTNTFVGLDNDEELRAWMEGTDKHVLYAD